MGKSTHHGQHHTSEDVSSMRPVKVQHNIVLQQANNFLGLTLTVIATINDAVAQNPGDTMAEALRGVLDVAGAIRVQHPAQNVLPTLSAQENASLIRHI